MAGEKMKYNYLVENDVIQRGDMFFSLMSWGLVPESHIGKTVTHTDEENECYKRPVYGRVKNLNWYIAEQIRKPEYTFVDRRVVINVIQQMADDIESGIVEVE
jgi:hypothetical protein